MANITRFDPFAELTRFHPFGDDFFRGFSLRPVFHGMEGEPQIRLDVSEDDKNYTVKAEIPGVKKEDIKVTVDGNQVSISAEVKKGYAKIKAKVQEIDVKEVRDDVVDYIRRNPGRSVLIALGGKVTSEFSTISSQIAVAASSH